MPVTPMNRSHVSQGSFTPNIERSEGIAPSQFYHVASYLPLKRFDRKLNDYVVFPYGKAAAADSNGYLVPAGLALDIKTALTGAYSDKDAFISAASSFGEVYTTTDVSEGVLNFAGDDVTAGEPVVASFFETYDASDVANLNNPIGSCLGMIRQDGFRLSGSGYDGTPLDYRTRGWNPQEGVAVLTRYFLELPLISNLASIKYPGLTVFNANTAKPGDLVTFTKESNFTTYTPPADLELDVEDIALSTTDTYADSDVNTAVNAAIAQINTKVSEAVNAYISKTLEASTNVVGKVYFVDPRFPKDLLDHVKGYDPELKNPKATDVAAGTNATKGLPDSLSYAGVTDPANAKMVRFNLVVD